MAREIIMSFDVFGKSKIDAVGFVGNSCEEATKAFVDVLRAKDTDDEKKPEYGLPNEAGNTVTSRW